MSKKETLEEVAERLLKSHQDFKTEGFSEYQNGRLNGIIEGLKWQQDKKLYSEQIDMLWLKYRTYTNNEDAWCFKEWLLEQFKNK
jgi:hypothetical protein